MKIESAILIVMNTDKHTSNDTNKLKNYRGCGVVFDSRIPHKANPVISGVRDVLVGWASGPRLR